MRAAYLFHLTNLLVSILMVPLLLGGLSVADYAIWLAFVAFGNATIQVQNAVQTVVIKDIARAYHAGSAVQFHAARRRTFIAYLVLAVMVLGPMMIAGLGYFRSIGAAADLSRINLAWVIFALAYTLVYVCAPFSALLIGTDRVEVQNNINTFTRIIQLAGVAGAMSAGVGILGLCVAFGIATSTGSILSGFAARGTRVATGDVIAVDEADTAAPRSGILRYILFAGAAYCLYNGMYLVAAAQLPRDRAASYGLVIQIATLLTAIAIAPFNVWLTRLTRAVATNDHQAIAMEVARTFLVANLVFVMGFVGLMLFGTPLLHLIGAAMRLPDVPHLVLIGAAFMIEVNILVLVNYLMVRGDYRFVGPYVIGVGVGIMLSILTLRVTGQIYSLIAVPALVQGCVALPLVLRRVSPTMGGGLGVLVRSGATIVATRLARYGHLRR